jgi:hypothetical protein
MNNAICNDFTLDPNAFIIVPDGSRPEMEYRQRGWRTQDSSREKTAPAEPQKKAHSTKDGAPLWTWFIPNPRPIRPEST